MRRSHTTSFKNKAEKAKHVNANENEEISSTVEIEDFAWGTKAAKENIGRSIESALFNGKIIAFNVVWRERSTKKHKIWEGDGILQASFTTNRAVLKNDNGKYLGCTSLKGVVLAEGLQMLIGSKEIELLEQIKDQQEYWRKHNLLMLNRGWGEEEYEVEEPSEKKPKGNFVFRPNLVLNAPYVSRVQTDDSSNCSSRNIHLQNHNSNFETQHNVNKTTKQSKTPNSTWSQYQNQFDNGVLEILDIQF